jgi:hypothetical protein
MLAASHVVAFLLGVAIVLATWQSIIVTIILPRRVRNWITLGGWVSTYEALTWLARRARDPLRRDAILALLGPVNIVGLLFTWMALFAVGFAFMMWATGGGRFAESFDLAGSSIFTLGFATGKSAFSHFLMDAAAASGMIVVGLQIGYLPTIYGAYSTREARVTLLTMRAADGGILNGVSVLRNHPLPLSADVIRNLFASWETGAAEIIESHTNYPWLISFRSPRATESWVTSMLAVLDTISLLDALAPSLVPPEAEHCRFACASTLQVLSRLLVPQPREATERVAPISEDEFIATIESLRPYLPIEREPAAAWPLFCASRAFYEEAALRLATYIMIPVPPESWLRPVAAPSVETVAMPTVSTS